MTDLVTYTPHDSIAISDDSWKLAQRVAATEFVPKGLRGKPEAVLACILTGHELGVGPMQALAKIHVVDGRPGMSAELMRAVVLRAGHEIYVEEATNTRVTVTGVRAGTGRSLSITWSMDDAKKAGLVGKDNWRKYPRAMLTARATAEVSRGLFPDVLAGVTYVPEELEEFSDDGELDEGGDEAPSTPSATTKKTTKRKAKKAIAAKKAVAPPPIEEPVAAREIPPLPGDDFDDEDPPEMRGTPQPLEDEVVVDREALAEMRAEVAELDDRPTPEAETSTPTDEPRYSGPQMIAISLHDLGVTDREERLAWIEDHLGISIESSKDLTPDQTTSVLQEIQRRRDDREDISEAELVDDDPDELEEPGDELAGGIPPDEWSTKEWRAVLKATGWKLVEVLRTAADVADDALQTHPVSLAAIEGTGLAPTIVERMAAK